MPRALKLDDARVVTFQAESSLVAAMEAKAIEEDRSVSSLIRRAVSAYLSSEVSDFQAKGITVGGPR